MGDLLFKFKSGMSGTDQPYRVYIPSVHNGKNPLPLMVALHGTSGDHTTYFEKPSFGDGIYKEMAEKYGFVVLCPNGRDDLDRPTEWRGSGEIHVLEAIEDVCRRIPIDRERIVLTGLSMGGTGTTYLCCRYPDIFAAGIPLASTYGHISLVTNLKHTPMYYMQGEKDWPIYAKTGPIPITDEMNRLNYKNDLWFIPEAEHNIVPESAERVFEIAAAQRRSKSPSVICHRTYFPAHGKAWWTDISKMDMPGEYAQIDASISNNRVDLSFKNIRELIIRGDGDHMDFTSPLSVFLDNRKVFEGMFSNSMQLRIGKDFTTSTESLYYPAVSERMAESLFSIDEVPTWSGYDSTSLGNLMADTIRDVAKTDVAIINKGHFMYNDNFRGAVPQRGPITTAELINWLRPSDSALATTHLKGKDIMEIIELNLSRGEPRFVVQGSGFTYTYNSQAPKGSKITAINLDSDSLYKVGFKLSDITRTDTMELDDLYDNIDYEVKEENIISAVWRKARENRGHLVFSNDKRVIRL